MLLDREIEIGPAEWSLWKALPITALVFQALSDERSEWVQQIILGDTLDRPGSELKETILAIGRCQGLTIFLEDLEIFLQQQWEAARREKEEREEREREENE